MLSLSGLGTREKNLIMSLFLPSHDELKEVARIMKEQYKEDLEERVKSELSGDLKKIMVKYVHFHLTC